MLPEIQTVLSAAKQRGLSQKELARRAGITPETLSRLAKKDGCRYGTLRDLAGQVGYRLALVPKDGEAPAATGAEATAPVGLFKDEAAVLRFITGRLVATLKPEEIWLFGSRAGDDARADSDFDILVVLADGHPASNDYLAAGEPLVGSGIAVDVVPSTVSDVEAAKKEPGSMVQRIVGEGRLLYRSRARRNSMALADSETVP